MGAVAGALAIGLGLTPAPASGLPVTGTIDETVFGCDAYLNDTTLNVGALFGADGAFVEGGGSWRPTIGDEPPLAVSEAATGTLSDGAYRLVVSFVDLDEAPVGALTVEGSLEPIGDPQLIEDRYRFGNAWNSMTESLQWLVGSGVVTEATAGMAAFLGAPLTCQGDTRTGEIRSTNPASRIYRMPGAASTCLLGDDGLLDLEVGDAYGQAWLALGVDWETGDADLVAFGELTVAGEAITGDLVVVEPATDPAEHIGLDLRVGSRAVAHGMLRWKWPDAGSQVHRRYASYPLSGSVTLPDDTTISVEGCVLDRFTDVVRQDARS